jgi:2-oxo-4-hydroxy-4-carboxy-5-ureidoimidazoline decarboxylase
MKIKLSELNRCPPAQFVAVCGPFFEHSPWIAERAAARRPFGSRAELHRAMCAIVAEASAEQQLSLARAHPELSHRATPSGGLTSASASEQSAAGLNLLAADDSKQFDDYNAAYRAEFGFPFIICARENRKASILEAFATRLKNTREVELRTALDEIGKIAWYRLTDAIEEE